MLSRSRQTLVKLFDSWPVPRCRPFTNSPSHFGTVALSALRGRTSRGTRPRVLARPVTESIRHVASGTLGDITSARQQRPTAHGVTPRGFERGPRRSDAPRETAGR